MAQGEHETNQADAVSSQADRAGRERCARSRKMTAETQGDADVDRTGRTALDRRDVNRIAARNDSRQIVVDRPA